MSLSIFIAGSSDPLLQYQTVFITWRRALITGAVSVTWTAYMNDATTWLFVQWIPTGFLTLLDFASASPTQVLLSVHSNKK